MDKIKFARLVAFVQSCVNRVSPVLSDNDIAQLNELTSHPETVPVDSRMVQTMIEAMASGKLIEAIKAHRSLTGFGLRESKEAIDSVMKKDNTTRWINVYRKLKDDIFISGTYHTRQEALDNGSLYQSDYIGPREISFNV